MDLSETEALPESLKALAPIPPKPDFVEGMDISEGSAASQCCERLAHMIDQFNEGLDAEHEAGAQLVNFGGMVVSLVEIGYWDPALIWLRGFAENGAPIELIQHVHQINIALMAVRRPDPQKPKRKIGFHNSGQEAASAQP